MDVCKRVCLKPDFILERIDNDITVYHPSLTTSLYLNESGALIWELCDGTHRVADIIDLLKQAYPDNSSTIEKDVITVVGQLVDHGLACLED